MQVDGKAVLSTQTGQRYQRHWAAMPDSAEEANDGDA